MVDADGLLHMVSYKSSIWHWDLLKPLLVCRQFYDECMPVFYKKNLFQFSSGYALNSGLEYRQFGHYRTMARFLQEIGPQRRKFIGGISISDKDIENIKELPRYHARLSFDLLGQSCHLRRMELEISTLHLGDMEIWGRTYTDYSRHVEIQREKIWACQDGVTKWWYIIANKNLRVSLPGFAPLEKLRGLKEVVIWDRNTKGLVDPNGNKSDGRLPRGGALFEQRLIRRVTQPKIVLPHEDRADVAAIRHMRFPRARTTTETTSNEVSKRTHHGEDQQIKGGSTGLKGKKPKLQT